MLNEMRHLHNKKSVLFIFQLKDRHNVQELHEMAYF